MFSSPILNKLSLEYLDLVLSKTRFLSHLSFLSRCLQFKVNSTGFKSSFTLHFNSPSHLVTKACYDHSRRLMRIALDALVKHNLYLDSHIFVVRSNFLTAYPVVLQQDITQFILSLNSRFYEHLTENKAWKLNSLFGPRPTSAITYHTLSSKSTNLVVTLPPEFFLSDSERSVRAKV